jgi:hypothetical protein
LLNTGKIFSQSGQKEPMLSDSLHGICICARCSVCRNY